MPSVQYDINVITEEAIEYSKHLERGSPRRIFDLANKISDYARYKLTPDDSQSMQELKDMLQKLRSMVAESIPSRFWGDVSEDKTSGVDNPNEIKKDILTKIIILSGAIDKLMQAARVRRMKAKTQNYGEAILTRATSAIRKRGSRCQRDKHETNLWGESKW